MSKVAIIDYGAGNLTSVKNALDILGIPSKITSSVNDIVSASRIILPGVGAFGYGMDNLQKLGLVEVLQNEVIAHKKSFLGICLGMQLIFKKSWEEGEFKGLGWLEGEVVKFDASVRTSDGTLRVPHVGWNTVDCDTESLIFKGGSSQQTFYFVHSYYPSVANKDVVIGWCEYGRRFPAAVQKDNIFAVQFHPEKSQTEGLEILRKFAQI